MLVCPGNENRLAISLSTLFHVQNFTGKTGFGKLNNAQIKLEWGIPKIRVLRDICYL